MATCSKCNANVPDGMAFCIQCGTPIANASPPAAAKAPPPAPAKSAAPPALPKTAPPPPKAGALRQSGTTSPPPPPRALSDIPKIVSPPQAGSQSPPTAPSVSKAEKPEPVTELKVPAKQPPAGGRQSAKFEGLDIELPPPEAVSPEVELEGMEERRRPSAVAGEAVCKFCKGPLNLEGGFCEYCGAPIEEAAPPGLIKPKPKPAASASNLAVPPSDPEPSVGARRELWPSGGGPPPANAPPQPAIATPPAGLKPAATTPRVSGPAKLEAAPTGAGLAIPSGQTPSGAAPPPVRGGPKSMAAAAGVGLAIPPAAVAPAAPAKPPLAVAAPGALAQAGSSSPPAVNQQTVPASTLPPRGSERVAIPSAVPHKAVADSADQTVKLPPRRVPAVGPAPAARAEENVTGAVPVKTKAAVLLSEAFLIASAMVVIAVGAAAWYFLRRPAPPVKPSPPAAATQPAATAPAPAAPAPEVSAPGEAAAEAPQPRVGRAAKPAPAPARPSAPAQPAADPKAAQIANLQNLARDAYTKGNYAEPAGTSAIAYLNQALALNPSNDYSKKLLESAVSGGTYQVQQAITKRDFVTAHRVADAMAQLLPGRRDVAGLKEDIASAQRAEEAAHQPQAAVSQESFRVMHMHTDKSPADKGPYCQGTLSVAAGHLKFVAQSATDGQSHQFDVACSDVREVKKNSRVASHQGGFHVRTTQTNYNFVPADAGSAPAAALAAACAK